jgi:transcriptional regulator with XRE-family HTH domain
MVNVAEKIKEIRRLGLSQEILAKSLNTTQRTVSRWEAGQVSPSPHARSSIDLFYRFASIFNSVSCSTKKLDRFAVFNLSSISSIIDEYFSALKQGKWPFKPDNINILSELEKISLFCLSKVSPGYISDKYNFSYVASHNQANLNIISHPAYPYHSSYPFVFQLEYRISNQSGIKIYQDLSDLFLLYLAYLLNKRNIKHANTSIFIEDDAFMLNGYYTYGINIDDIFTLIDQFIKEKKIDFSFLFDKYLKSYLKK